MRTQVLPALFSNTDFHVIFIECLEECSQHNGYSHKQNEIAVQWMRHNNVQSKKKINRIAIIVGSIHLKCDLSK